MAREHIAVEIEVNNTDPQYCHIDCGWLDEEEEECNLFRCTLYPHEIECPHCGIEKTSYFRCNECLNNGIELIDE